MALERERLMSKAFNDLMKNQDVMDRIHRFSKGKPIKYQIEKENAECFYEAIENNDISTADMILNEHGKGLVDVCLDDKPLILRPLHMCDNELLDYVLKDMDDRRHRHDFSNRFVRPTKIISERHFNAFELLLQNNAKDPFDGFYTLLHYICSKFSVHTTFKVQDDSELFRFVKILLDYLEESNVNIEEYVNKRMIIDNDVSQHEEELSEVMILTPARDGASVGEARQLSNKEVDEMQKKNVFIGRYIQSSYDEDSDSEEEQPSKRPKYLYTPHPSSINYSVINGRHLREREPRNEEIFDRSRKAKGLIKKKNNLNIGIESENCINGCTPLMFASRNLLPKTIELLLSKGARIDETDDEGNGILEYCMYAINTHYKHHGFRTCISDSVAVKVLRVLIDHGLNIDKQDDYGMTYLMKFFNNCHFIAVKILLSVGARVDIQDNYGMTILHYSCKNNHYQRGSHELIKMINEVIFYARKKENDGIVDMYGNTWLHYNILKNGIPYLDTHSSYFEYCSDVFGYTFDHDDDSDDDDCINEMLRASININYPKIDPEIWYIKNNEGKNPLDYIVEENRIVPNDIRPDYFVNILTVSGHEDSTMSKLNLMILNCHLCEDYIEDYRKVINEVKEYHSDDNEIIEKIRELIEARNFSLSYLRKKNRLMLKESIVAHIIAVNDEYINMRRDQLKQKMRELIEPIYPELF